MEAWLAWLGDISSVRSIVARRSTDLAQDIPVEWSTSQLIIVGRCMLVGRRNRQIGKSGSEGQGQKVRVRVVCEAAKYGNTVV
eukprot:1185869-Prorocentrum_minimum.AAC.3